MIVRSVASANEEPDERGSSPVTGLVDPARIDGVVADLDRRDGQAIFGFVRRLGLTDEEAEDCVQEAMARLWTELGRGTVIVDPKAWVYRTAYRLAMDQHRLRRRVAGLIARLAVVHPAAEPVDDPTTVVAVWAEVGRLPPRQRQVLYLRYRGDLAFDQIAAILGVTPSAARSHSTQAIQTIRRRLSVDVEPGNT